MTDPKEGRRTKMGEKDIEPQSTIAWSDDAWRHLTKSDQVMAGLAHRFGPVDYPIGEDPVKRLVRSIIGQQISRQAAQSILGRFLDVVGDPPEISRMVESSDEELLQCGLSVNKLRSVRDLANKIESGEIEFLQLPSMSDEQIIDQLTGVRGIGIWTAQTFLIFALGRPDVLLAGDLGVRKGVQVAYGLDNLPTTGFIRELAKQSAWHPFATAATRYLWSAAG